MNRLHAHIICNSAFCAGKKEQGDEVFATHIYEDVIQYSVDEMKKHPWFYESITKDEAEVILCDENNNCFLVRSTGDGLILSFKICGWTYHEVIKFTFDGFCYLRRKYFESIAEMIAHYQKSPVDFISSIQTLAHSCHRKNSGINVCIEKFSCM